MLDLNGDGVKLTDYTNNSVLFDIDHDGGSQEVAGWVSPEDGIVVMDLNNNGKIDNISETLSEYFNGTVGTAGNAGTQPYTDGFAALKSLDNNNDNVFNSSDAAFANVKVWVDANHDAVTDVGELKTLTQLNITQINLNAKTQSGLIRDGNEVLATGTFLQNGQTKEAIAANFLANPNGHTFITSGSGTQVITQGGLASYTAGNPNGETIDVTQKGVINAYGAQGNDILTGNNANNWLAGGAGIDIVSRDYAAQSIGTAIANRQHDVIKPKFSGNGTHGTTGNAGTKPHTDGFKALKSLESNDSLRLGNSKKSRIRITAVHGDNDKYEIFVPRLVCEKLNWFNSQTLP